MGRIKLETLSQFMRHGYLARVTCRVCKHSNTVDPFDLRTRAHRNGSGNSVAAIEDRMKCSRCGWRGAWITAAEPDG